MADTLTDPTKAATMEVRYQPRANARVSSNFNPSVMAGNLQSSTPPATTWRPSSTVDILTSHRMMTEQIAFEAKLATAQKAKVDLQRETLALQEDTKKIEEERKQDEIDNNFFDHVRKNGGTAQAYAEAMALFPDTKKGREAFVQMKGSDLFQNAVTLHDAEIGLKLREAKAEADMPDEEFIAGKQAIIRNAIWTAELSGRNAKAQLPGAETNALALQNASTAEANAKAAEAKARADEANATDGSLQGRLRNAENQTRLTFADEMIKNERSVREQVRNTTLTEEAISREKLAIAQYADETSRRAKIAETAYGASLAKNQEAMDEGAARAQARHAGGYAAVNTILSAMNDGDHKTYLTENKRSVVKLLAAGGFDPKDYGVLQYGLTTMKDRPEIATMIKSAVESYKSATDEDGRKDAASEMIGVIETIRIMQNDGIAAKNGKLAQLEQKNYEDAKQAWESYDKSLQARYGLLTDLTTKKDGSTQRPMTWSEIPDRDKDTILKMWEDLGGSRVTKNENGEIKYPNGYGQFATGDGILAILKKDINDKTLDANAKLTKYNKVLGANRADAAGLEAPGSAGAVNPPSPANPQAGQTPAGGTSSNVVPFIPKVNDKVKGMLSSPVTDQRKTGTTQ